MLNVGAAVFRGAEHFPYTLGSIFDVSLEGEKGSILDRVFGIGLGTLP
jgi:hypothetical protein